MGTFNALSVALANAGVAIPESTTATTAAPTTADALAALQAAIAAGKAKAEARRKARGKAKAEVLRRIEARRDAVARRDDLLHRVVDLGAAIADARDEYDRAAAPLAQALAEARRLGDLVPAEVLKSAQAAADALREEFNAAQAQRTAELRRLQTQVRRVEEGAAYRAHLDILDALHAKGGQTLARANEALNAKDFDRAERLASKALRSVFPDDIRERAEKFVDAVRYRRRNATRAVQGKWFARARAARHPGDVLIAVGVGQFAHLRPMGSRRHPKGWTVVSAIGYDAPAKYSRLPRGARRLSWNKKKGGA